MSAEAAEDQAALDTASVARHLAEAGLELAGPLSAQLITTGRSNLTYRLTDGAAEWILRRPPLGHVLATAHDMGREFTVLRALAGTAVPVPRAIHLCEDQSVIGAQFLLMEYVTGPVLSSAAAAAALSAKQAGDCATALVAVLATLHSLDPGQTRLGGLGKGEAYLARQVRRWRQQWQDSTLTPVPAFDRLAGLVDANLPDDSAVRIVHGDYRLGNVILDPANPGRIAAVIDWEMATLGDPLADLGLLLAYWHPASSKVTAGGFVAGANPGFPDADQVAASYLACSGLKPSDLAFYRVFGFFKLAAIAQTIVARYRLGAAVGAELTGVADAVGELIEAGLQAASHSCLTIH